MNKSVFRLTLETWQSLLMSRKFWLLVWASIVAAIGLTATSFYPDRANLIMQYVAIVNAVVVAVIVGIFVEDAADKQAYYDAAIEYYKAEDECDEVDDEDWDLQEPVTA